MNNNCVAILGAFTEFSELYVRYLCNQGYHVALLDLDAKKAEQLKNYGLKNPNHFSNLNVSFYVLDDQNTFDSIVAALAEIKNSYELCGLLNIKEKLVIEGAKAAEVFDLLGVGTKAATVSRNKYLQRALFQGTSYVPHSKIITLSEALEKLPSKGVLKPINEHGSVGVVLWRKQEHHESVKDSLKSFSPTSLFLIEELIEGPEYSLEAWISQSKVVTQHVTQKGTIQSHEVEFPVENSHEIFVEDSLEKNINLQLQEVLKTIITKSQVQNAIVHLEFKVSPEGVKIMEWCVRNPGDRIMDLYYYSGAFNPYALYADICLGKKDFNIGKAQKKTKQVYFSADNTLNALNASHPSCYWPSHSDYAGFVRNLTGLKIESEEALVHEVGVLIKKDDLSKPPVIRDSFSRHAYVILSYPTTLSLESESKLIEKSVRSLSV